MTDTQHQITLSAELESLPLFRDLIKTASQNTNSLGSYELFAVNADGTNRRVLLGQDYLQNIQPADRHITFDFAPGSHTVYFPTEQYDLHRVNADSGAPTPVFGPGQGGFFSFSPNGQWMVLSHPDELVLARPDGANARVVFKNPPDSGYVLVRPDIIWEPDSTGFHIVSASGPPQDNPDNMTVWFIPVAGNPVKQMSYTGPYGANLSPDGRTVVYLDYQHAPIDVHVVSAASLLPQEAHDRSGRRDELHAQVTPPRVGDVDAHVHASLGDDWRLAKVRLVNGLDDDREVLRHRYPVLEQEYALRALESDQLVAAVDLIESLGGGYHNPDIEKRPKHNPS